MKMKKIKNLKFVLMILILVCVPSVFAYTQYERDELMYVDATYKENGLLTSALANMSVNYPNGTLDTQKEMDVINTGVFMANYTTKNVTGDYLITIEFFNATYSLIGKQSKYITVGDSSLLNIGTCPSDTKGLTALWVILILLIVLAIVGMSKANISLLVFSGFMMILMTLIVWKCAAVLGIITIVLGILFLLIAMSIKSIT